MILAFAAVNVVLARETAHICSFVEGDLRVRTGSVALFASRDQILTRLAAELSEPVAIFTDTRTSAVLTQMREYAISNVALARSILLYLEEITGAFNALFRGGAPSTPIYLALFAHSFFQVVAHFALSASILGAVAFHAV